MSSGWFVGHIPNARSLFKFLRKSSMEMDPDVAVHRALFIGGSTRKLPATRIAR